MWFNDFHYINFFWILRQRFFHFIRWIEGFCPGDKLSTSGERWRSIWIDFGIILVTDLIRLLSLVLHLLSLLLQGFLFSHFLIQFRYYLLILVLELIQHFFFLCLCSHYLLLRFRLSTVGLLLWILVLHITTISLDRAPNLCHFNWSQPYLMMCNSFQLAQIELTLQFHSL